MDTSTSRAHAWTLLHLAERCHHELVLIAQLLLSQFELATIVRPSSCGEFLSSSQLLSFSSSFTTTSTGGGRGAGEGSLHLPDHVRREGAAPYVPSWSSRCSSWPRAWVGKQRLPWPLEHGFLCQPRGSEQGKKKPHTGQAVRRRRPQRSYPRTRAEHNRGAGRGEPPRAETRGTERRRTHDSVRGGAVAGRSRGSRYPESKVAELCRAKGPPESKVHDNVLDFPPPTRAKSKAKCTRAKLLKLSNPKSLSLPSFLPSL